MFLYKYFIFSYKQEKPVSLYKQNKTISKFHSMGRRNEIEKRRKFLLDEI